MHENEIAKIIVDCAYKVHKRLGPGLLENVYQAALAYELGQRGLKVAVERGIPVEYDNVRLNVGFRADIIVENKVIIECKAIDALSPIHSRILLTYLRLTDMHLGLLINFNVEYFKEGVRRVVNNLLEQDRREEQY
ncbi:MAG: GxxExxY protein [Pyrinomonadaceae bacterium]